MNIFYSSTIINRNRRKNLTKQIFFLNTTIKDLTIHKSQLIEYLTTVTDNEKINRIQAKINYINIYISRLQLIIDRNNIFLQDTDGNFTNKDTLPPDQSKPNQYIFRPTPFNTTIPFTFAPSYPIRILYE